MQKNFANLQSKLLTFKILVMKKTFFKQVFKLRVMASVTVLLGITFLLYACSEDNIENPDTDATESIEVGDKYSMKLMVDGQFEKNIADASEVEDGVYMYVVMNSDEDIVHAFTDEDAFEKFENYNVLKSNMPGVNGKTAKMLPDYNESEVLAEIERIRSNAPAKARHSNANAKSSNFNDFDDIFDYEWPDYDGGIVGHFEFDGSSFDTHYSIDLNSDTQANTSLTHIHWSDIDAIYDSTWSGFLKYCFSNADHIVLKSTHSNPNFPSLVWLYTGTNYTGTTYLYVFYANESIEVPNRNYNSIWVYNS